MDDDTTVTMVLKQRQRLRQQPIPVAYTSYDRNYYRHLNDQYTSNTSNHRIQIRTNSTNTNTTPNHRRLQKIRNVGILAHVDAGKTTVTERMLALAGIVTNPGSVDSGNTVTDYLPAERERGITIQSAAISFPWIRGDDAGDDAGEVDVHLIDTPGHVDFSVEVNRSVAVLDGAVLVLDAVAGVQAQTETVWRAMTRSPTGKDRYRHEPLPCLAMVNKMDREGCDFGRAIGTIRHRLPGANPVPVQVPLLQLDDRSGGGGGRLVAIPIDGGEVGGGGADGRFVGVVDLVRMRTIVWPEASSSNAGVLEECIPTVSNLPLAIDHADIDSDTAQITRIALAARNDLVAALAETGDELMEDYFFRHLEDEEDDDGPSAFELCASLRRATVARRMMPVLAGAALRGKGVEPLLDAVVDLLPSPMDRLPPALIRTEEGAWDQQRRQKRGGGKSKNKKGTTAVDPATDHKGEMAVAEGEENKKKLIELGHPLHPSLLALAFKVVHMKGRGGSGDGRVVFARVYSGSISSRDTLKVITPNAIADAGNTSNTGGDADGTTVPPPDKPRTERVGGMLDLAGGQFSNRANAICHSGDVCALVGLRSVTTGDTLLLASDGGGTTKSKRRTNTDAATETHDDDGYTYAPTPQNVYLAGVSSPKPVLSVRIETTNTAQHQSLTKALALLITEDPSLRVEETGSATVLSGLGELHIEVVADRIRREHGLDVWIGKPTVTYHETVVGVLETDGMVEYDRTVGDRRLQGSVGILLEPMHHGRGNGIGDEDENEDRDGNGSENDSSSSSSCLQLSEPIVTIEPSARSYLGFPATTPTSSPSHLTESELALRSSVAHALLSGCHGALRRGPPGTNRTLSNVHCRVIAIDAEGGLTAMVALPGAMRAAASAAVSSLLEGKGGEMRRKLEPTMDVEVTVPGEMVGVVLSDLSVRRGTVGDVVMGDDSGGGGVRAKALVRGEVPLAEILGYANSLRSITAGEGTFTAEYKGHSYCDQIDI